MSRPLTFTCHCCVASYSLSVDWSVVNDRVARMTRSDRLLLDRDCLQWTPSVHSDDDDDDDDDVTDGQVRLTTPTVTVVILCVEYPSEYLDSDF